MKMKTKVIKALSLGVFLSVFSLANAQTWNVPPASSTSPSYFGTTSSSNLNFGTNKQTRMTITHTGRVGIGTTSPSTTLGIRGNSMLLDHPGAGLGWIGMYISECDWCNSNSAKTGDAVIRNMHGNMLLQSGGNVRLAVTDTRYPGTGERVKLEVTSTGQVIIADQLGINVPAGLNESDLLYVDGDAQIKDDLLVKGNVLADGQFLIGTSDLSKTSGYKLAVNGAMIAESVKVKYYANWPDFVFNENYELKSLEEVEEYISVNKHLPGVPSAEEVHEKGIDVGEMNAILLQKIEELTLYQLEMLKKINEQEEKINELSK